MAGRSWASSRIFNGHIQPVHIDCNFVVDSTNGNGLGIRNLKGAYVQNVFMHTSATPGVGNSNNLTPATPITNPNPASGLIVVQFMDAFYGSYAGGNSIVSPLGSSSGAITAGNAYILTSLGTATSAQLHAAGIPKGVTPAIGVAFIAASSETLPGSATAASTTASTVANINIVGDSNIGLAPYPIAVQGYGGQIILECRNYSDAVAAPVDGTVIALSFLLSNSGVKIQGD